ncbi:MAG: ribonucleoside-diphosphate reductase, partial [Halobacteria archaeon]|nr:ribonucleoside-diphosphate reductase [Halobacteria archaeon]
DESVMNETLGELIQLVQEALAHLWEDIDEPDRFPGLNPEDIATYAAEKHTQRMNQIVDSQAKVPEVDELTALD